MHALPKLLPSRELIYAPTSTRSLSEPPVVFFPSVVDPMESSILPPLSPATSLYRRSKTKESAEKTLPRSATKNGIKKFRHLKLGNLFLSSCPGKKVRLEGPIRGKRAVCRNLELDFKRVRQVGVRCIVCCLDDDEMQFLGTPWEEYCRLAHQEGLDVLRIPLPEGLCPLSPQSLDKDLARIIERYTINGIPVLVHCRGGVGRAGLVACCWLLKLGLCGWIETDVVGSPSTGSTTGDTSMQNWDDDTVVRKDTLQIVERVIGVVRVRRSVKAIETLEQVKFLVEYVDYLRIYGREDVPKDH